MDKLEDFPKEKLQEIYEVLPEDLKQALFSQEIADIINDICAEDDLDEKQISKIIEYAGYVFLGLLSPNDFEKAIKEKLFLSEDLADRINRRIIRIVFLPLKTSLELIHKTKMKLPPGITEEKIPAAEEIPLREGEILKEVKTPPKKRGEDIYRESVN